MERVDAFSGADGMKRLLDAFVASGREFSINVMVAVPVEGSSGYHLLFTIGDTTAAMTVPQTQWLADHLINQSACLGRLAPDLQNLGRMMLEALAEAPGVYGAH